MSDSQYEGHQFWGYNQMVVEGKKMKIVFKIEVNILDKGIVLTL